MNGYIFSENANIVQGFPPADLAAIACDSDVINVTNQHCVTFILIKGAGAVGTGTVTVQACDDVTPSNTTAIPFQYRRMVGTGNTWGALTVATAAGFVTTAAANDLYEITVDPAEVTNATVNALRNNHFVRLHIVSVDATAVNRAILVILPAQRYPQETPISAIA